MIRKYIPLFCHQRKLAQTIDWLFISVIAATISFKASPAYPWGSKGHEIVAAIAEPQLTDVARKRIKELLPQGTTLTEASTSPDKAGRQIPDMDAYHYVNFPKDANAYDQQRDCKLRNCVIEAIAWYLQVLKSPDAPRNEKRIALRFVAHLIGDIHQPLHAGFAEDRGGNSVDVSFNGRKENLHSLWDTALVESEQGTPAEIAKRIQAVVTSEDLEQWQQGRPTDWALESLALSEDASLSAICVERDHRKLRRSGTRCDSDAPGPSGIKAGLAAESDVAAVKSIRQALVNSSKSQA